MPEQRHCVKKGPYFRDWVRLISILGPYMVPEGLYFVKMWVPISVVHTVQRFKSQNFTNLIGNVCQKSATETNKKSDIWAKSDNLTWLKPLVVISFQWTNVLIQDGTKHANLPCYYVYLCRFELLPYTFPPFTIQWMYTWKINTSRYEKRVSFQMHKHL